MKISRFVSLLAGLLISLFFLASCENRPTWQQQYDLGIRYLSSKEYEQAILTFYRAIEIDPLRSEAYLKLADAYLATEDMENALAVLAQGIEMTGNTELQERQDEIMANTTISVAEGGQISYENWSSIPSEYYDLCENILEKWEISAADSMEEDIRNELTKPILQMHPETSGTLYYGDLDGNGMPDGRGVCIYTPNEKSYSIAYVGDFSQGMRDGQGLAVMDNGYYVGGWKNDRPNGPGEEKIEVSGDIYLTQGNSIQGKAEGFWLECHLKGGQWRIEDGDPSNGVDVAGYRYLCERGEPVPMEGTNPSGEGPVMAQYYTIYSDGTESFEPAPHEHAGGMNCAICKNGGQNHFHAYESLPKEDPRYVYYHFIVD